jgi:tetratricopeptide (TPR) repeat protein
MACDKWSRTESNMAKTLIELEKFSLLKWDRFTNTLSVHRLLQTVVKDEMSDTELRVLRTTVISLCDQSFPRKWTNETRPLCRIYLGQIVGPLLSLKIVRTEKFADVMCRVGWFLREDGKASDSEQLLLQAIDIQIEILGLDHPDTLRTMNFLASTYCAQGKTAEAAALHEEVLEKRKQILGDEHPDTLRTVNNLGSTYRAQGKTADAAALHEEALEKRKRILGMEHPHTLATMNSLALTYRAQGKMAEAAALHEEVLEKRKRILGDAHPDTLTTMSNFASTYCAHRERGSGSNGTCIPIHSRA